MKAAAIGIASSLATATPVAGQMQSIFNDPQRRAYVVPFARQATDCLAGQLADAPNLLDIVKNNRVREALAAPFRTCADDVDAMIAAHDRAYYPGAGEAFFRGPYLAEVPRAVSQRLQKEVARREQDEVAKAAKAAAEANAQAALAAEQQKVNDAAAAKLWAENDRRQALARQASTDAKPKAPPSVTKAQPEPENDPRVRINTDAEDAAEQRISPLWYVFGAAIAWFLLKALIRAMKWRTKEARLLEKYGDPHIVERIMQQKIWEGMTAEQVVDSWGSPADIGSGYNRGKTTATYKYNQTGKNRFASRVYLTDGMVTGWEQK